MIKPCALSHAAFRVSDLKRSREFYENVLGLRAIERPNFSFDGTWYGLGENQIHLIVSRKRKRKIDPLGPHVALQVENYDAMKATLEELGLEFVEAKNSPAGRQLWVLDPDGNTIELRAGK